MAARRAGVAAYRSDRHRHRRRRWRSGRRTASRLPRWSPCPPAPDEKRDPDDLQREQRGQERRLQRVLIRAQGLSDDDLVQVLAVRAAAAAAEAKAKAKAKAIAKGGAKATCKDM